MNKGITILAVFIFILLIITGIYFINDTPTHATKDSAIGVIPLDAGMIIETKNTAKLIEVINKKQPMLKEIKQIGLFDGAFKIVRLLDSISGTQKEVVQLLENRASMVSFHLSGKRDIEKLFAIHFSSKKNAEKAKNIIYNIAGKEVNIKERNYSGTVIYQFRPSKNSSLGNFSFAFHEEILMLSESAILLESAVRQADASHSIARQNSFAKVYKTAGKNALANVFLNFEMLPKAIVSILNGKYVKSASEITRIANWAEMDISIKESEILLNGFVWADVYDGKYLSIFSEQKPQETKIISILPSNTFTFVQLGIENMSNFLEEFNGYLQQNTENKVYDRYFSRINSKYKISLKQSISSIIDNEIALVFTTGNSSYKTPYAVIEVLSKEVARTQTNIILQTCAKRDSTYKNHEPLLENANGNTYEIYKNPFKNLPQMMFGNIFAQAGSEWFTYVENYMVFAKNVDEIKEFVHYYEAQKTLINDKEFNSFFAKLSASSTMFFYADIKKMLHILTEYTKHSVSKTIDKFNPKLRNFKTLGYQFHAENNLIYNTMIVTYEPATKQNTKSVWETRLEKKATIKPQIVINHYTKDKELLIQDAENRIYLINNAGKMLWKKEFAGKIMGKVHQIDYYKNNKLQLLFNTSEAVHLLDRNGNYVDGFPVTLQSKATCPMSLFDYDGSRDYRILIPCADKSVRLFDKNGVELKGWVFKGTVDKAVMSPKHFRVGKLDYIIIADYLKTYIVDRKGKTRINVKTDFPKNENCIFAVDYSRGKEKARFVTVNTSGKVFFIDLKGNTETLGLRNFSHDHHFRYFDFDGDGQNEYIFLDNNELHIFAQNAEQKMFHEFPVRINDEPLIFSFSSEKHAIGIFSSTEQKAYLFDSYNTQVKGFPLESGHLFSIGNLSAQSSDFSIILPLSDGFVYCYKLTMP